MRIQTQLFLGTAVLLLALVGFQWWLQIRQLKVIERELTEVVTNVGEAFVFNQLWESKDIPPEGMSFPRIENSEKAPNTQDTSSVKTYVDEKGQVKTIVQHHVSVNVKVTPEKQPGKEHRKEPEKDKESGKNDVFIYTPKPGEHPQIKPFETLPRVELETNDKTFNRFLVIRGMPTGDKRIPLPASHSKQIVQETQNQVLMVGSLLLLVGWLIAALFAHRVTQPLRQLAVGVEALGRGEFGTQVKVTSKGELGELQSTFNRMSARLAELEKEKVAWQAREHLVELGDLARGLGHTLRNPLNTLGLVVEELASKVNGNGEELVTTARGQIRRIDRWLRSFLAIGAGGAAEPEMTDLTELVRDVAFEAIQSGKNIEIQLCEEPLRVNVVPSAFRSALANLVENAVEASPEGVPITITVGPQENLGVICITDQGPGLPQEVREKLFTPHITTKVGGSGMGIFLAKQLIEGGHGGKLEFKDGLYGGTEAIVQIPLVTGGR